MTDGVTVTSLPPSLQHKTRVTSDRVCHIALHQKLYVLYTPNHVKPNIIA